MSNSTRIRFLAVKIETLEKQLSVSRDVLSEASKEIDALYKESHNKTLKEKDKEHSKHFKKRPKITEEEKEKKDIPLEAKNVFRKLALQNHPDKFSQNLTELEKEDKEKIFRSATEALNKGDIISLYNLAINSGLEVPDLSVDELKKIENKINAINKEINFIQSTLVWKWHFELDNQNKDKILKNIFELMNAK